MGRKPTGERSALQKSPFDALRESERGNDGETKKHRAQPWGHHRRTCEKPVKEPAGQRRAFSAAPAPSLAAAPGTRKGGGDGGGGRRTRRRRWAASRAAGGGHGGGCRCRLSVHQPEPEPGGGIPADTMAARAADTSAAGGGHVGGDARRTSWRNMCASRVGAGAGRRVAVGHVGGHGGGDGGVHVGGGRAADMAAARLR